MVPIQINAATPGAVKRLIRGPVEGQFNDVHSMMMLPNCNFAATAILVNLISGFSTIFYTQQGNSGDRFKSMLKDFYPWDLQPSNNASPEVVIQCLYDTVRNPLAHSLGVQTREVKASRCQSKHVVIRKPSAKTFGYGKQSLPKDLLDQLERSPTPPGPTLTENGEGGRTLSVDGLYWGVRTMLSRLTDDTARMQRSDMLLSPLWS